MAERVGPAAGALGAHASGTVAGPPLSPQEQGRGEGRPLSPQGEGWGEGVHLLAFAAYLVLTLLLTYPLPLHFTTHIPGGNVDEGAFLWNLWWIKHAIGEMQSSPLATDYIFYPLGINLALYTLTLLNGLLALPITLAFGPIVAANALFVASFVLSGFAMYLLALDCLGAKGRATVLASFVAGVVYAFASSRFLYAALGQYDYVSVQWLPLFVLFFLRAMRLPGWRAPILAGIFAAYAALTEMNFIVFILVFVFVYLAYTWIKHRREVLCPPVMGRLCVVVLVFLAGFAPLGWAVVREVLTIGDYLVRGWGGADRYVIDLLGPLVPSPLHPVLGPWGREAARRFSDINFGFVGYVALALAFVGAVSSKLLSRTTDYTSRLTYHVSCPIPSAFWPIMVVVFFLLALGPLLHINGQADFDLDGLTVNAPLPYIVIHYLPFLKGARIPGRFGIMATLALAVLVAVATERILGRLRWRSTQVIVAGALSGLILAENLALPLPLTNAVAPEPYKHIASDPADFTILQIPLGWRDGFGTLGAERTIMQAYQAVHGKRILGGNTSRSPAYVLPYFARMPVLRSIIALEEGRTVDPTTAADDRSQAADLLRFLSLRYVVVHGDYVGGPLDRYIQSVLPVERLAAGTGQVENSVWHFGADGKWVEARMENAHWVLYALPPAPGESPARIDLGTPKAHMHVAAGWSRDEAMGEVTFAWADARQAIVLTPLEQAGASALVFRAAPFSYPGAPQQRITVAVNGHRIGQVQMTDGWADYRLDLPARCLRQGINEIRLTFAHIASPAAVLGTSDRRTLAAAFDWIAVE